MNRQEVNREVQQMCGIVPGFFTAVPDNHIGPLWESMRKLQMEPGVIPPKYQQLIMLGAAVMLKCKYCMFFHTEIAKAMGATQAEITEAALLIGNTGNWSSFINGIQYDYDQFQREVRTLCDAIRAQAGGQPAVTQPTNRPTGGARH